MGIKYFVDFACKVIPPRTPFPTETPKNNFCFFLLKSCSWKRRKSFLPPWLSSPRARGSTAPRPRRARLTGVTRPPRAREPMTVCAIVTPHAFSLAKLSPRATHFQQKPPKITPVFSSLKVVLLSKKVVFSPFIVIAPQLRCTFPATVVKPPHNCGVPSPQLWGSKNVLWKNINKGQRNK